jgi:pectate lyase
MPKRLVLWAALLLCGCAVDQRQSPAPKTKRSVVAVAAAAGSEQPRPVVATTPARAGDGALPAFPGAEGFAARVTGGRGGRVIKVTSLGHAGHGTLQAALDATGPRIVVFAVSGVIEGDITVNHGDVTIAGQTAPGAGITIKGRLLGKYRTGIDNIVIRHLRVRPVYDGVEPGEQFDAIQFSKSAGLMLDHVSASFAVDETIDVYEAKDVTVQWSVIESSETSGHPKGKHNYGLINGPGGVRVSVHHNLFAHHLARCPAIANGPAEVRNNVMYNVRHGFVHHNPASGPFNIVGNYFKAGPDDTLIPFFFDDENGFKSPSLGYYLNDNTIEDVKNPCRGRVDNPWKQCQQDLFAPEKLRAEKEYAFGGASRLYAPVTTQASTAAYDLVLKYAGAFPRDVVTRRSLAETRSATGTWGARYPDDFMAGLKPAAPPKDTDNDGMPDSWETEHHLDPENSSDAGRTLGSGYTAVEVYINELADRLVGE